jgi:hypothetical protein
MKPSLLLASEITFSQDVYRDDDLSTVVGRRLTADIALRIFDPNRVEVRRYELKATDASGPFVTRVIISPPTVADLALVDFLEDEPAVTIDGERVPW